MKKIILLISMLLILIPIVSAGFMTVYNPFTSKLDYVRNGNWTDYNGTVEFGNISVTGISFTDIVLGNPGIIYSDTVSILRFTNTSVTNLHPAVNCGTGYGQIGDNWSIRTCNRFYGPNEAAQFGVLNSTTLNTGQGAYELYAMNQNVQTTSNVIFNTLNSTGAMKSTTLDTGQGANELYDMDQNVLTTSNVKYNSLNITGVVIGTYNCTLYDAYGCVIGYNATCRFLFSTDGTGKFSACNT